MQEQRPERSRVVRGTRLSGRQQQTGPSLPSGIADKTPSCIQPCLENYIGDQFDAQCVSSGLSCMCATYSSQGFTLGELALSCAYVNCSGSGRQAEVDSYNVCNSVRNAVTATHTVLTVAPATTTIPSSTSSESISGSATTTNNASSRTHSPTPNITSTASSASSTADASSAYPHGLSASQVAGVAIGSIGGVALLGALLVYILYRRRLKRRSITETRGEKDGFDFIDRTPAQPSSHDFVCYQPSQHQLKKGGNDYSSGTASPASVFPRAKANIPQAIAGIGIGGAMSSQKPESTQPRNSQESTRTVSQLLPDPPQRLMPNAAAHHQPGRVQAQAQQRPQELPSCPPMRTPAAVFEENSTPYSQPAVAMPPMPYMPPRTSSLQTQNITRLPPTASFIDQRQPALSLEIPRQSSRPVPQSQDRAQNQRGYPRGYQGHNAAAQHNAPITSHNTYQSNTRDQTEAELASPTSATPIDEEEQRRRAVPAAIIVTKPTRPPRSVQIGERPRAKGLSRQDSTGSCTSFESRDEDEALPRGGNDDKQLSPVQEHSPISGIRYPTIPQSVYTQKAGSPDSMARKRRGDVPLPLRVGTQPQVRNAQERYAWASHTPRAQEVEVKSPLWEPKLTPSRRGDDLFLSVSLASPR